MAEVGETLQQFTVDERFCGPPGSANGGYFCGMMAKAAGIPSAARVRLEAPPPLGQPFTVQRDGDETSAWHGEQRVARAWPIEDGAPEMAVPTPPGWRDAVAAVEGYAGFKAHHFPRCFVCGPERAPQDGLRVFPGPTGENDLLAAPWLPDASLANPQGRLHDEHLWAALDCPGAFTCEAWQDQPILLGELIGRIDGEARVDDALVVIAWPVATEGRKHFAGTAIFRERELLAHARATWISLKR